MAQKYQIWLTPKTPGAKPRAVQQDIQLVGPGPYKITVGIKLSDGTIQAAPDPSRLTGTFNSSNPASLLLGTQTDALNCPATLQAGATDPSLLSVHEVYNDGSFGPFDASANILPPVPPLATPQDVVITVA
jgi:hypothetical protein